MPDHPGPAGNLSCTLQALLAEAELVPRQSRLTPLSGGRTNRLWRIDTAQETLVAKLYSDSSENPLFANDPAAEVRLLRHLGGGGLAPRYHASLETPLGPILLYTHVEGAAWRSDTTPVAETLARLHATPVPPGPALAETADGSGALTRQTLEILNLCPTQEAASLRRLAPQGEVPPSGVSSLLHGDVVPGNLIHSAQGITLIDWQCPAQGDPVHDLSLFLSPAMQHAYRGAPLSRDEEARFMAAYGRPDVIERYRVLAPWFHWRMAAYCLWRVSQGTTEYQPALEAELASLQV